MVAEPEGYCSMGVPVDSFPGNMDRNSRLRNRLVYFLGTRLSALAGIPGKAISR
jgi:hypothetical protein